MRYTHFEIENFKGIKHLKLDLQAKPQSPVYTLVGLNESGKTTILEALNFFTYGAEDLDPLAIAGYATPDIHDLIPIAKRSNFNDEITIRVGLELDSNDENQLRELLWKKFSFRAESMSQLFVVEEKYPFSNSKHDASEKTNTWTFELTGCRSRQRKIREFWSDTDEWDFATDFLRDSMPRIWYFPNFLFDFPDRIYLADSEKHSVTARKRNAFYRQVLQDILDSLGNDTNLEEHIIARSKSEDKNDRKSLSGLLLEMGREVTKGVFGAWNEIFHRNIVGKKVHLKLDRDDEGLSFIRFRIEDSDGYFEIAERSLGFRWFFVYLLITSYRGYRRGSQGKLLFLFDEPASNLHSAAQTQLLKSFGELARGCSIIYTTHSHHLINPNWLETTFVVRNAGLEYKDGDEDYSAKKTEITIERYRNFVAENPSKTSYFQPILDVLDYQPSVLENVPFVVMLEGKNDFYVLRYMATRILGAGKNLNLLPGNGAGSLDTLIRLYMAWGRQFCILLDADTEGVRQKNRYSDLFGPSIEDKLFSLQDVNPKWQGKGMERMFLDEDLLSIQAIAYPEIGEYRKTHFNRAVQEAFVTNKVAKLSSKSKARFEKLLAFLSDQLDRHNARPIG